MQDRPVVVGVDGTNSALRAVAWAATEARLRHRPLHIVHAAAYLPAEAGSATRDHAEAILARARTVAHEAEPGLATRTLLAHDRAVPALTEASRGADLLVVGMIGERESEIVIGSVALGVTTTAHCPVCVVRGHHDAASNAPVLLGLDDAERDAAAVTVAFADAERHHSSLVVLHVARGSYPEWSAGPEAAAEDLAALRRGLAPWQADHPAVPVEVRIGYGAPTSALLRTASTARQVVVGSRARGSAAKVVLGSVSRFVLRRSSCPVTIVPRTLSPAEATAPSGAFVDPHDPSQLW